MRRYAYAIVLGIVFIAVTWGYHAHEQERRENQIVIAKLTIAFNKALEYAIVKDSEAQKAAAEGMLLRNIHGLKAGETHIVLGDFNYAGSLGVE